MDTHKCPVCRTEPIEPINLKCDHHPCFTCASAIMTLDQETDLEVKYKIVCPLCQRKTVTYDIRHLIISMTEQDEDLYVTTKYLSKKPEVQIKKPQNNYVKESFSHTHSKRNSSHGIMNVCSSSSRPINFQCKHHPGMNLQYYCEDCANKNNGGTQIFFCLECSKSHSHKRLVNIRQALEPIEMKNKVKRDNTLPSRKKELDSMLMLMSERQQNINGEFEKLYKTLNQEFKQIYQSVNEQYEALKKDIKSTYSKQSEELKTNMQFIQRLSDTLNGLDKMLASDSDIQTHVSFYMYSAQIEKAIQINKSKLGRISQTPKLVRKASQLFFSGDKLVQLAYGNCGHRKTLSKLVSPSNSARTHHGPETDLKKGKGHFNFDHYTGFKENYHVGSPKASFDYKK